MYAVGTFFIRRKKRANQEHCGACRSDERGKRATDSQENCVVLRGCANVTFKVDTAGDDEERKKQSNELNVFNTDVNQRFISDHVHHECQRG